MGNSADAILVFGFDLGEEQPEQFDEDFEEYIWNKYGKGAGTHKSAWAFSESYPITLVRHSTWDFPCFVLGLTRTQVSATWGSPKALNVADFTVTPEEVDMLKKWCAENNIGIDGEPSWILCSMWG